MVRNAGYSVHRLSNRVPWEAHGRRQVSGEEFVVGAATPVARRPCHLPVHYAEVSKEQPVVG
jgi:hypothetical protein